MAPAMPEMLAIQPMARSQWPGAGVERRRRNWPAVARAADAGQGGVIPAQGTEKP